MSQTQHVPDSGKRPRILSISFSPLRRDARVLRQIGMLAEHGDVTTVGYGPRPAEAADHVEIPGGLPSLPQTLSGVALLALRAHGAAEFAAPALAFARDALAGRRFDLVVANDARALPVAFTVANGTPVWADLHEWAPAEQSHILSWRLLVSPFMTALCRKYLPSAAATTTVSPLLAEMYEEHFGVPTNVVRNAPPFADLAPTPVDPRRIRLVHSGVAIPDRCIEVLIDATLRLDEGYSLDLFLVASDDDPYLAQLVERAAGSERVVFHPPVAPDALPSVLNGFDVGVFLMKPTTTNHRFMLPNKFFDFVQARIAVVFGQAIEVDRIIAEYDLGVTVDGFAAEDLVRALDALTPDSIAQFKRNADQSAMALSSHTDVARQHDIVRSLLAST